MPVTDEDIVRDLLHRYTVLWNPLVGPDLRSALYQVLATVPGVKVDSSARDGDGRQAVEISRTDADRGDCPPVEVLRCCRRWTRRPTPASCCPWCRLNGQPMPSPRLARRP